MEAIDIMKTETRKLLRIIYVDNEPVEDMKWEYDIKDRG